MGGLLSNGCKSAFLNSTLKEEVYVEQPPGSKKAMYILKLTLEHGTNGLMNSLGRSNWREILQTLSLPLFIGEKEVGFNLVHG